MYAAGNRNSESLTLLTTDNATTLLKSQISNLIISSSDLISRKNICPNNIARRLASFCSRSNPTVAMKNNPTLAGASWAHQFLWPYLREGYLYSASVALLAFASVALFAGTAEGVLELCACCMLCGMDVFGIVYEAVSLAKDRRARAVDFLGNVQVKRSDGEWESVSGFDLKPGDVVKLQQRSVVPADMQWVSGDALLCDTTFALQGEVYQGAGGDTGRDLSGLLRLYDGPESAEGSGQNGKAAARAAAQAKAATSASGSDGKAEGLRQRNKSPEEEEEKKKTKAPPTEVGGVTIEEVSSNDEEDDDDQKNSSSSSSRTAEAVGNPYADVPTMSEVDAGALVLDTGGGVDGFATCRVLRTGPSSHGWARAAQVRDQTAEWRRNKRPKQLPHLCGAWSTLLVCALVAWMVPALLRARAVQGPPRSFLGLVVAFFKSLPSSLEEITGLSLADLLPKLSLPSFLAEMPDDLSFNDLNNADGAQSAEGDSGKGSAASASDGSDEGLVALADLVAVDQCKSLLHAGLAAVGYSAVGFKLLLRSAESVAQRTLARRGCLFKPATTGCTAQRLAEVDTLVLCHLDPRAVSKDDAAALHRLQQMHGLDVKILAVAPVDDPSISSSSSSNLAAMKGGAAQARKLAEAAAAASGGAFSAAEFEAEMSLGQEGQRVADKLLELGLTPSVATIDAQSLENSNSGTNTTSNSSTGSTSKSSVSSDLASSKGLLVQLLPEDWKAHEAEVAAAARRAAAYTRAVAQRRQDGPHLAASVTRPVGCSLPRSAVADAVATVRVLQRQHDRKVMVTADDNPDGRTLPLLRCADVGCVTGNTHLTPSSKKQSKASTRIHRDSAGAGGDAPQPQAPAASTKPKSLVGGDVALGTGLPLGLSPLADMLTVARAASRIEHAASFARAACLATVVTLLLLQVQDASTMTAAHAARVAESASSTFAAAPSAGGDTVPSWAATAKDASSLEGIHAASLEDSAVLAAAVAWASSVVRRSVVFGGSLRVPLALLLCDVLALTAMTPEPPQVNARGVTEQFLSHSTAPATRGPLTREGLRGFGPWAHVSKWLAATLWGAASAAIFRLQVLPYAIPYFVPQIHPWLAPLGWMFIDSETATTRAGGDADAAAARALAWAQPSPWGTVAYLDSIDKDTCCFLFGVFACALTGFAGLAASRATIQMRLWLVVSCGGPLVLLGALLLATNGLFGGVEAGGDPAAAVATLLFCMVAHGGGGFFFFKLLRVYP